MKWNGFENTISDLSQNIEHLLLLEHSNFNSDSNPNTNPNSNSALCIQAQNTLKNKHKNKNIIFLWYFNLLIYYSNLNQQIFIHPAAKLIGLILLNISIQLCTHLTWLCSLYFLSLIVIAFSQFSTKKSLIHFLLFAPIVTFIFSIPLYVKWNMGEFIFQPDLLIHTFNLVLKVALPLALQLILLITTPWNSIIAAFNFLKIPSLFILIFQLAYLFLLNLLIFTNQLFLARKSRILGPLPFQQKIKIFGSAIGTLFEKTIWYQNELNLAMQARGFSSQTKSLNIQKWSNTDTFFIGLVFILSFFTFYI